MHYAWHALSIEFLAIEGCLESNNSATYHERGCQGKGLTASKDILPKSSL